MRKKLLLKSTGFEKPGSREEAIMQNILGASNVLEPAESNIEEILQSILYNIPYTKEAEFEIEKILLAIKNNSPYDGDGDSRDMRILIAILNDLDYTEGTESRIEELFVEWLHQRSKAKVLEGVPPLTFVAKGNPLINYEISGNTVQTGTPTPDNPIEPEFVGELVTEGEYAGQYVIPISSGGVTKNIYLGQVQSTRKIKKLVLTGEENFILKDRPDTASYMYVLRLYHKNTISVCSHLPYTDSYPRTFPGFRTDSSMQLMYMGIGPELQEAQPGGNTVEGFRYYLAAQYAAGTPVVVWYVLATPEVGIFNEPLCRIGDYADSVNFSQAGVEIPTVSGSNTLDVNTTVKPSNIYIEYK